jgi:hypothetical protein
MHELTFHGIPIPASFIEQCAGHATKAMARHFAYAVTQPA